MHTWPNYIMHRYSLDVVGYLYRYFALVQVEILETAIIFIHMMNKKCLITSEQTQ